MNGITDRNVLSFHSQFMVSEKYWNPTHMSEAPYLLTVCFVFYNGTKNSADDLSSDLCLQGIAVQCLHGDREQCVREEALKDFKDGM